MINICCHVILLVKIHVQGTLIASKNTGSFYLSSECQQLGLWKYRLTCFRQKVDHILTDF